MYIGTKPIYTDGIWAIYYQLEKDHGFRADKHGVTMKK